MTQPVGLFQVHYAVGGNMPGAVGFNLHLAVYTPGNRVTGFGQLTQATNPPLDITSQLSGDFTYMTVMPDNTRILVVAQGYPPIHWPPHGGIGPVIPANIELRMVLERNWQSGTASFRYRGGFDQPWCEIESAPVRALPDLDRLYKEAASR